MRKRSTKTHEEGSTYQASEDFYRILFDEAADGIFVADHQGRCIDVNRHGYKMLGYTREEVLGLAMEDLVTAEDLAQDPLQLNAMRAGTTLLKQRRLRCKDGRFLPVEISARMLADGRFLSVVRDISERKRAEEQLRESNEHFYLLAESSLAGIYLIQENRFRYVNPAMAHIFGYEVEEITDKLGPMDLVYPDDRPLVAENLRRRIDGEEETIHYDFRGLHKDSSVIDVDVHGRRIEYGGKTAVIGTLINITERRLAEENILASEQLFRALVENSPDFIARYDREFRRVYVNPAIQKLFGSPAEDVLNKTPDDQSPVYAPQVYIDQLQQVIETATERTIEMPFRTAQGEMHWGHMRFVPEFGLDSGVASVLAIGRDITNRIHAENALRESEQKFRGFVEESFEGFTLLDEQGHIIEWNRARERITGLKADKVIGRFLWDVQHQMMPPERQTPEYYERNKKTILELLETGQSPILNHVIDAEVMRQNGDRQFVQQTVFPIKTDKGYRIGSVTSDITERKLAEEEHLAHLWFLESMDQVNRAIQGTNDLDQMMSDVLDAVLSIFDCDRAGLVYPCDPEAASWQVPMERTRPEYPGALALGAEIPTDSGVAQSFLIMRASRGPVKFGPESEHPLPTEVAEQFGFKSFIALALYPKVGKPWEFVLHQCSYPRVWTPQEERLFQELGQRLADGLTSLLSYRSLRESETRFRTFVDHAADAFYLHSEGGAILDVNHQACESLGYNREELLGMTPFDFDAGSTPSFINQMGARLAAGEVVAFDTWHRRKDGSVFPVEVRTRPLRQDGRNLAVSFARDITKRKRADEALRASEERYRALYLDNPSMFFTLDSAGMIISVNAFGASQLGYTIDELEGQSILNVFFEDDRTAVTNQLQNCVQNTGQTNQWQLRKVRKDGSLLWVEEFARAITDANGAINILIVCQDITDRKQAEIEQKRLLVQIQEQAQQVQNIIDTVPEGVVLLSQDQSVTLTNPVAREFLALLAPEFQNGRLTHLGQRPLNDLLTSPPKGLWHELTNNDLVFEAITRPVENGPDNSGWVLVLRDITQERDIQQRIQRQERLAAVGQLAAGIAHDFNNILAVIALYTQLIARTVEMPPRYQERVLTIEQQIKRATDLIQQILDFSRQSILERQPLDLLSFTEKLVVLLERTLPEHIQIEQVYTAEAYFIQADPSRIQQVLMNLAVNARDAMPDGGHLTIKLAHVQTEAPTPMSMRDLPPGNWVQIAVTDNGKGIPQEALSRIFEPFFTTKEVGEGTGLGLAQVYGIVEQHEGYIDVITKIGQGTTFSLYFPALNIGTSSMEIPDSVELQLGQGQRILLVEDNLDTREALLASLVQLNYDVLAVTNGREALKVLASEAAEFDLVVSDVVMPEMGGTALFHAIQEQNLTIPVVLLTGHPLSQEMEHLKALGLAGWLPKPPDLVNLSYLLAEVLSGTQ